MPGWFSLAIVNASLRKRAAKSASASASKAAGKTLMATGRFSESRGLEHGPHSTATEQRVEFVARQQRLHFRQGRRSPGAFGFGVSHEWPLDKAQNFLAQLL